MPNTVLCADSAHSTTKESGGKEKSLSVVRTAGDQDWTVHYGVAIRHTVYSLEQIALYVQEQLSEYCVSVGFKNPESDGLDPVDLAVTFTLTGYGDVLFVAEVGANILCMQLRRYGIREGDIDILAMEVMTTAVHDYQDKIIEEAARSLKETVRLFSDGESE